MEFMDKLVEIMDALCDVESMTATCQGFKIEVHTYDYKGQRTKELRVSDERPN